MKPSTLTNPALVRDAHRREFFLGPINAWEARGLRGKMQFASRTAGLLSGLGITPCVAAMAACRQGEAQTSSEARSWDAAEKLVARLRTAGFDARNVSLSINAAVDDGCNLILVENGVVGNQVARTLLFLGGGDLLAHPVLSDAGVVYEDCSRDEVDFCRHVAFAASWATALRG